MSRLRTGAAWGAAAMLCAGCGSPGANIVQRLGPVSTSPSPEVAADGDLGFDLVWVVENGSVRDARLVRGRRSPTRSIALGSAPYGTQAAVAANARGAAVLAWAPGTPGTGRAVEMRYRSTFAASWGPVTTMRVPRNRTVGPVRVGIDAGGDAYVAWRTSVGITLRAHPGPAHRWTPARLVEPDRGIEREPSQALGLAVSPSGAVAIAWEDHFRGGVQALERTRLRVRVRSPQGRWFRAVRLGVEINPIEGAASLANLPPLSTTFGAAGELFTTWVGPAPPDGPFPRVAVLSAASGWRRPRVTEIRHSTRLPPVVAADRRGDAVVVWESNDAAVASAEVTRTGRVVGYRRLGVGGPPQVVGSPGGEFAGDWGSEAAYRTVRGWCPTHDFTADVADSALAIAPDGHAMLLIDRRTVRGDTLVAARLGACAS